MRVGLLAICRKKWRETFQSITKRSNRNRVIACDRHLKIALLRNNCGGNNEEVKRSYYLWLEIIVSSTSSEYKMSANCVSMKLSLTGWKFNAKVTVALRCALTSSVGLQICQLTSSFHRGRQAYLSKCKTHVRGVKRVRCVLHVQKYLFLLVKYANSWRPYNRGLRSYDGCFNENFTLT